jgi:hypothetical protein
MIRNWRSVSPFSDIKIRISQESGAAESRIAALGGSLHPGRLISKVLFVQQQLTPDSVFCLLSSVFFLLSSFFFLLSRPTFIGLQRPKEGGKAGTLCLHWTMAICFLTEDSQRR